VQNHQIAIQKAPRRNGGEGGGRLLLIPGQSAFRDELVEIGSYIVRRLGEAISPSPNGRRVTKKGRQPEHVKCLSKSNGF
jgi:hypothetical protein